MKVDLSCHVELVTGAARGIGWAIADLLTENGPNVKLNRRRFMAMSAASAAMACVPGCRSAEKGRGTPKRQARLFFTSQGRTALINADGTGLHYLDFKVPEQATWQPGPFLSAADA